MTVVAAPARLLRSRRPWKLLSETVSEITFQKKPSKFKEKIIASKVSGSDNGISFNRAEEVNFDFYRNTVLIADNNLVSPIADRAFSFYTYKLEGSFYDKNEKLTNQIEMSDYNVSC